MLILNFSLEYYESEYSCHNKENYIDKYVRHHSTSKNIFFIIYLLEDEQELSLGMLIRLRRIYNFWLFHANILQLSYTFGNFLYYFGTNILIQCPVSVPIGCMFYVSQKPNITRSPNGTKTDGEYIWNIYDFWEEKSTRDGARGGHEAGGVPAPLGTPLTLVAPP